MTKRAIRYALVMALGLAATPVVAQDRLDWRDGGRDYAHLVGPGVPILFPELRASPRGKAFVMRNFDWDRDGVVSRREAAAANRAFDRVAGRRHDQFDWDAHARGGDRVVVVEERGHWDRGAMHGYDFRQSARGATLTLSEDVLFATDSAVLRPGAIDKLRALADYLRDEPGVRVAIDGYTDARGSDAHNQDLSQRRAASVRDAFDQLGVTRARFAVVGHGEASPVASNTTAAGQRQNRRVEVTLLGRRAAEFAGQ